MNALNNMTNVEKAKLMHQLFPHEIPALLETIGQVVNVILTQSDKLLENWKNPLISPEQWIKLAERIRPVLEQYGNTLPKRSSLFADQLFDGYLAFIACHCVIVHADKTENKRFAKVAQAFFGE